MATFTRDWDESNPTDNTNANEIDDYNRYLRVDISDRLKDMVYGLTAGENDGVQGFKQLEFKQKASAASQPNADEIVLYALDDGSNCGLYAKEENNTTCEFLKYNGSTIGLNGDVLLADTVDEDAIRLDNNSWLTARNAAGDGDINCIKVNASDVPEILVGAVLSDNTAPGSDAAIANKKYVDDKHVAAGTYQTDGTTVFNTTLTAANTFQDLDLSSYVGSNTAFCYLEVTVSSGMHIYVKPKGNGSATATNHQADGAAHSLLGAGEYTYFVTGTDSSGICQIGGGSTSPTVTIKLLGFIK